MPDSSSRRVLLAACAALLFATAAACSPQGDEAAESDAASPAAPAREGSGGGQGAPGQDVTAPPAGGGGPAPVIPFQGEAAPATVQDGVVLRVLAEGEISAEGTMTMPAMEQDMVYLMARVETESGAPIIEEAISVRTDSGNQILLDDTKTDEYGYAAFTLFVSEPGLAEFTLAAKGVETRFRIDVMRLDESPWLEGLQGEGITRWSSLRGARIAFKEASITADFNDEIASLDGQRVKLSGYMMPMTPDMQQSEFLLSASPPDCFFHMPGGPTTIALVETSPDSRIGMTMDPLVVEGTLHLVRESPQGLVYRLTEARQGR